MEETELSIRDAEPGQDDDAVVKLMSDDDPPADPAEIRGHLEDYRRPRGRLLLAEADGVAAGVGALRMLAADVAEVKRMYVDPRWRDLHVGSAILDRLLDEARLCDARLVRLDTCRFMSAAQALYRSRGFQERPPYDGTEIPERLQQYWIFFERGL